MHLQSYVVFFLATTQSSYEFNCLMLFEKKGVYFYCLVKSLVFPIFICHHELFHAQQSIVFWVT